ncbi:MAG: hypothetical protein ABIJ00_06020 [Candidatus Eisenbacteria bacterium]
MRTPLIVLAAVLVCVAGSVQESSGIGLGIVIGEPTGVSFKQWMTDGTALAGAAAWSFENEGAFHAHVDYLFHRRPAVAEADAGRVLLYAGIGGRIKAEEDDSTIGVRVPLGIDYVLAGPPLDVFFEVAPVLDVAPSTEFRVNGGVGIRYYF